MFILFFHVVDIVGRGGCFIYKGARVWYFGVGGRHLSIGGIVGEILANGTVQVSFSMSTVGSSHQIGDQGEHEHGGIEIGEEERFGISLIGEDALSRVVSMLVLISGDSENIRSLGSWTRSRDRPYITTGADRECGHQVLRIVRVDAVVQLLHGLTGARTMSEMGSCRPFRSH